MINKKMEFPDTIIMFDMSIAPKDKHIILIWETPNDDNKNFDIREGWWEDFSYLPENRNNTKPKPQWQYVNDNGFIFEVKNPIGWLPLPIIKQKCS